MKLPYGRHQQNDHTYADVTQKSRTLVTSPRTRYVWGVQKEKVSNEKGIFLRRTLEELNKKLEEVHASASIQDEVNGKLISVKPLPGSGDMPNWEDSINSIFHSHLSDFREERQNLPSQVKFDYLEKFLAEQSDIPVCVEFQISEWRVLRKNCSSEIVGVKNQAKKKNVKVVFPRYNTTASTATITLSGEPAAVSDIKVQVEMLKANVYQKITKIAGVPALMHVLKGMEDELKVLESNHKAVIEVDIESGENGASGPAGILPQKLCGATAPDATQVSVFAGDFTQHQHVGTLINFITPLPNVKQGTMKLLIDAGRAELQTDFEDKVSQFVSLNPPQVIKSKHGKLKCMQLLHCVIPPWSGGNQNETFFLEQALKAVLGIIRFHGSLLITPATSLPFKYPPDVFASKVVEVLVNKPVGIHSSDIQAIIYVDELSHASHFEECLKAQNFQINVSVSQQGLANPNAPQVRKPTIVKASTKAITNPFSSFIKVSRGDMLQHQVTTYMHFTELATSIVPWLPFVVSCFLFSMCCDA